MRNTIDFSDITLIGVDGVGNDNNVQKALKYSSNIFPNATVKFLTSGSHNSIDLKINHVSIPKLGYDDFSKFCLSEWYKHFNTTYMINCHGDGFATSALPWTYSFLDYDYIGAPWPSYNLERSCGRWKLVKDAYEASGKTYRIGNGGFSIRTRKLMKAVSKLYKDEYYGIPEDLVIAVIMRKQLEHQGFRFVDDIGFASRFSCEATFVDGVFCSSDHSVGFHCGGTHPHKVKLLETI